MKESSSCSAAAVRRVLNQAVPARIFYVLFLMLTMLSAGVQAADLVKQSKPAVKIYVAPEDMADAPDKAVRRNGAKNKPKPANPGIVALAVEDLNYHLEQMSGTRLEIVKTSDPSQVPVQGIVIGRLAEKAGCAAPATKWKEGYRILVDGDRVYIAGESMRAASHGVYAFLRILGCDWVMPGKIGEIIPRHTTVSAPRMDISSSPDFGVRNFWYRGGPDIVSKDEKAEYAQWTRRQRLGKADMFANDREGHFWGQLISENKKEFAEAPDMLALVKLADGTTARKGPQIETTDPRVVKLIAESIARTFNARGWAKDSAVTLPVGPADGDGYSVSPESAAAGSNRRDPMAGGGDVTDLVVKLANDVLKQTGAEYPNLALGYLVYSVHSGYPVKYTPDARIYPTFAPINFSRLHSTEDAHSKSRAYHRWIVEQWSDIAKKQGNRLQIYEYNWNLTDNMLPFTRLKMFGEDIPFYHRMNFDGFILESTKAWAVNGPHDYVAAQMVWDSSLDWKKLLDEYCVKAFGAAAPMMKRYYLRMAEIQSAAGQEAGSYYSAPLIFDDAYIAAAQKDLDEAIAQKLSPDERVRTAAAAMPLGILRNYLLWRSAMGRFEFANAVECLNVMDVAWRKLLAMHPQFAAREAPKYAGMFLRQSTETAIKYSTAPYEIVWKFPETLPTALDPDCKGDKMCPAQPDMNAMKPLLKASAAEAARYSVAPYNILWRFPETVKTAFDPAGQGDKMNLASPQINDSDWVRTNLIPGGWSSLGIGFYRGGAVWYRVNFELPKGTGKVPVGLFLGGFDNEAKVWVNGRPAGSCGVKFARPAVFDLTGLIRNEGGNLIAIQIMRNSNLNEIFAGGLFQPCFVFSGPDIKTAQVPDTAGPVVPGAAAAAESKSNMASPELDDTGWLRTKTWSSTWDAQGLGFYREGAVWYRVRFKLPEAVRDKPVGLFLGGFEDEAGIWVNGKYLGSSGVKFAKPAVFDLTGSIRYDGENLIAIRIMRNSRLNEIFTGGIFQSCFVFSGPRIVPGLKKIDPEFRVLPGGEQEVMKNKLRTEPEKRVLPGGEEETVPAPAARQ